MSSSPILQPIQTLPIESMNKEKQFRLYLSCRINIFPLPFLCRTSSLPHVSVFESFSASTMSETWHGSGRQVGTGTDSSTGRMVGWSMVLVGSSGSCFAALFIFSSVFLLSTKVEQPKWIVLRQNGRSAASVSQTLSLIPDWRRDDFNWYLNLRFEALQCSLPLTSTL